MNTNISTLTERISDVREQFSDIVDSGVAYRLDNDLSPVYELAIILINSI